MSQELRQFLAQFNFRSDMRGCIGIERERFLATPQGIVVPRAQEFLERIDDPLWTYELSACQVEDRTRPRRTSLGVWLELLRNDRKAKRIAEAMGVQLLSLDVGPRDMPLDVYPTPRYQEIVARISPEQLRAACWVAGVHVHVGMDSIEDAIRFYNACRERLEFLCTLGDHSHGERLRLYKTMAEKWEPPKIENAEHFFEIAREQGFHENLRGCYWLIRISGHGTVELRMFGSTKSRMQILNYVQHVWSTLISSTLLPPGIPPIIWG